MAQKQAGETPSEIIIQKIDIRQVVRNSIDIQSWRNALRSAESTTRPQRILLYDLYDELLLDGRLSSAIDKRKRAVTNTPMTFTVDGEEMPEIMTLIQSPWFSDMISDILDSRFYGHSLLEFTQFLPDSIDYTLIPRKHVVPETHRVTWMQGGSEGVSWDEMPYYNYTLEAGKERDLGLILKAAPYVIFKRNGFSDYAQFCEIFGIPMRIGKYNLQDPEGRQALLQALNEAGSALSMVIPEGTDVEIKEPSNVTGGNTLFSTLIDQCNKEISIIILGQTLTTEQGTNGARSLGEVHMDVEEQIHMDDRQYIVNWLNYEFKWLLELHGYKVTGGAFDFVDIERVDLGKRIEIDTKLNDVIYIDPDYFYEKYGIPKPDNADAMNKEMRARKLNPLGAFNPAQVPQQQQQSSKQDPKATAWLKSFRRFFPDGPRR
jgi:phage gp29-like protein